LGRLFCIGKKLTRRKLKKINDLLKDISRNFEGIGNRTIENNMLDFGQEELMMNID
jgi:hypothetical protein